MVAHHLQHPDKTRSGLQHGRIRNMKVMADSLFAERGRGFAEMTSVIATIHTTISCVSLPPPLSLCQGYFFSGEPMLTLKHLLPIHRLTG